MRALLLFGFVAAVSSANLSGYNYNPAVHTLPLLPSIGGSGGRKNVIGGASSIHPSGLVGLSGSGAATHSAGSIHFGGISGHGYHNIENQQITIGPAEYKKEFYSFSAPEQEYIDETSVEQIRNSLKKNLRVIFIKNPENKGLEEAAINLAKHAAEQKTAIYILNKQVDLTSLSNKLNTLRSQSTSKPEVHFVKYRTEDDARNAQKAIQLQYDNLSGSSHNHDGGVANVLNFASPTQLLNRQVNAPRNAYLPTSVYNRN